MRSPFRSRGSTFVFVLGVLLLLVALSEILLGSEGLIVRNRQVLEYARYQNAIEWGTGIVLVLASVVPLATVAGPLVVGIVYLLLALAGGLARHRIGGGLGFQGPLPISYELMEVISAALAFAAAAGARSGRPFPTRG